MTIKQYLLSNSIPFEENVSLKSKTWLKTGGISKYYIFPETKSSLKELLIFLAENNSEFDLVGHTSNIYYLDTCKREIVISTLNLTKYADEETAIYCECGVPISKLSKYAVQKGYIGYYGLINLPGTIGAALCNNSSCFDCSVSNHLLEVEFFNLETRTIQILQSSDFNYEHRTSNMKKGILRGVVLSARLSKENGDGLIEMQKAEQATLIRHQTQEPPAYTLGSVYTNLLLADNTKNFLVKIVVRLLCMLHLMSIERTIKLRLTIFGYHDLIPFVSSKNINTFIWLRQRSDKHEKFVRYANFVSKAYVNPIMEIEVRE